MNYLPKLGTTSAFACNLDIGMGSAHDDRIPLSLKVGDKAPPSTFRKWMKEIPISLLHKCRGCVTDYRGKCADFFQVATPRLLGIALKYETNVFFNALNTAVGNLFNLSYIHHFNFISNE